MLSCPTWAGELARGGWSFKATGGMMREGAKMLHFRRIESSLGRAARKTFEMLPQGQRVFSANFAKGEATGFAKGEAKGKADAILLVLKTRGLPVSAEQRQRILNCTRAATLDNGSRRR